VSNVVSQEAAHWIGDDNPDEVELVRLRALEETHDNQTRRLLTEVIQVEPGWRCLELGAGAGSMARWLAAQVGPSGSVVAADLNCRFLVDMPANVEMRELDARTHDFGVGEYDLVHHRAVLSYVSECDDVLARLAASLRPGGWLLSEEPVFNHVAIAGDDDELIARFLAGVNVILRANGCDIELCGRLPRLLRDLGLDERGYTGHSQVAHGGDHQSRVYWPLVETMRAPLKSLAGFTDDEVDALLPRLQSPDAIWVAYAVISAWGRKPR
jgi:SAM-dependent methyltransferase